MTDVAEAAQQQLHRNPKAQVCSTTVPPELPDAVELRVTGEVEFVDDADLTRKVAEEQGLP